jgi:hypothetical protein
VKIIIKLLVVALLANALWHVGTAYTAFYRFKDAVTEAATQGEGTAEELQQKIVELASTYDVPLAADDITVTREAHLTAVRGSYRKPVSMFPGFEYQWPFSMDLDAYPITLPTRRGDLLKH